MAEQWRQALHLEPARGWLNDPNGLCWFQGRYHVFYQFCPDSPTGAGDKCWGHFESPDLLRWKDGGAVLRPDAPFDRSGVYSGSAVVKDGKLHLFYTGNVKLPGNYDYTTAGRESAVVHVVSPDGLTMGEKRPVLTNADYPADCGCHVRDPKVWKDGDGWKLVLGARTRQDRGEVLLYRSPDLEKWEFVRAVTSEEPFGYMWECPDCFTADGLRVLSVSPQGLPHGETRYQNVYQSGWFPLSGPLEEGKPGAFTEWDMGFDFYAPQTFEAPDGRRLLIGWMGMPDAKYRNPTAEKGWQHCLTLPRELFRDGGGRLCQRPARELGALCGAPEILPAGKTVKTAFPFSLAGTPEGDFQIRLADGAALDYDSEKKLVSLSFSGETGAGRTVRRARLERCRNLQLIADASSLEIYLDGGSCVFSTRMYPPDGETLLTAEGADFVLRPMAALQME